MTHTDTLVHSNHSILGLKGQMDIAKRDEAMRTLQEALAANLENGDNVVFHVRNKMCVSCRSLSRSDLSGLETISLD